MVFRQYIQERYQRRAGPTKMRWLRGQEIIIYIGSIFLSGNWVHSYQYHILYRCVWSSAITYRKYITEVGPTERVDCLLRRRIVCYTWYGGSKLSSGNWTNSCSYHITPCTCCYRRTYCCWYKIRAVQQRNENNWDIFYRKPMTGDIITPVSLTLYQGMTSTQLRIG